MTISIGCAAPTIVLPVTGSHVRLLTLVQLRFELRFTEIRIKQLLLKPFFRSVGAGNGGTPEESVTKAEANDHWNGLGSARAEPDPVARVRRTR